MAFNAIDLRYAGIAYISLTTNSAFSVGDQMKISTTAFTLTKMAITDAAYLCVGTSLNSGVSGDSCALSPAGPRLTVFSDGAGAITAGDGLTISATTAGKVVTGTAGVIARALSSAPATAGTPVDAIWMGGIDTGATPTLASVYTSGSAAADQLITILSTDGGPVIVKAGGAATGTLLQSQDSTANVLLSIADNASQVVRSAVADGATAVGVILDTLNAIANATGRVISIRNATVEQFAIDKYGDVILPITGAGIFASLSYALGFSFANTFMNLYGGGIAPIADNAQQNGTFSIRWGQVASYFYETKLGAQLTAANTITPTAGLHHITGATTVKTIAVTNLYASSNVRLTLVADSALITWDATGNIGVAGTVAQGNAQDFQYDATATKWYPVL